MSGAGSVKQGDRSPASRTRERGIRMVLGFAAAIQHILFEVDVRDPLIFAGVPTTLRLVVMLACLIPAIRATLIDPLVAMRAE